MLPTGDPVLLSGCDAYLSWGLPAFLLFKAGEEALFCPALQLRAVGGTM